MATKLESMNENYKNFVKQLDVLKSTVETTKGGKADSTDKTTADTYKKNAEEKRKDIDTEIENIKKDASKSATEKQEAEDIEKTLKGTEESIEALHDVILKPIEAKTGLEFYTGDVEVPKPENLIDNKPSAAKVEYTDPNIKDKFKTLDPTNPKIKVEIKVTVDNNGDTVELRKGDVEVELKQAPATTPKTSLSKFTAGTAPDAKDLITEDLSSTGCTIDYKDSTEKEKFDNAYKGDVILVLKDKDNRVLREITVNNVEVEGTATIEAETGKTFPEGTPPDAKELVKGETADDKVEYEDSAAAQNTFKNEGTNKVVNVKVTYKNGTRDIIPVTINVVKQSFFEKAGSRIGKQRDNLKSRVGEEWNAVCNKQKWEDEPGKNFCRAAGFAATGVGAIALVYKGIKNLFGGGKSKDSGGGDDDLLENTASWLFKHLSEAEKKSK